MRRQLLGQELRVQLRPTRVTTRLRISDFGQRQQRLYHQALRRRFLLSGELGPLTFDCDPGSRHDGERQDHAGGRKQGRNEKAVCR
jgi:hypothetical protein